MSQPGTLVELNSSDGVELVPTDVYRCGKCGAILFRKDQLLPHRPFEHKLAFEKTKRVGVSCLLLALGQAPRSRLPFDLPEDMPSLGKKPGADRGEDLLPQLLFPDRLLEVARRTVFLYPLIR